MVYNSATQEGILVYNSATQEGILVYNSATRETSSAESILDPKLEKKRD